jgi:hypothetical protein
MADITKLTHVDSIYSTMRGTMDIIESKRQLSLVAGATLEEGTIVAIDGTTGKAVAADASADDAGAAAVGITVRKAQLNEAVTVLCDGVIGGFDFTSQNYGIHIFLSNTAGAVSDTAGTFSLRVGKVVPVYGTPSPSGAPKKALMITL